jgi:hypothetical protein
LGTFFHKLIIFKCLLGFLNPTFSFIAVTKLNEKDHVFFYAQLDPHCMREEVAALGPPASPSLPTTVSLCGSHTLRVQH